MIAFPSALSSTSLGDLLGVIFRGRASGTLELVEPHGRAHRVHVTEGHVTAVDVDRATPSLAEMLRREEVADEDTLRRSLLRAMASHRLHGEVLVSEFRLSKDVVDRALRKQLITRLSVLEQLGEARVHFRVTVRTPRGALTDAPLAPREFLHGRRRARDRMHEDREPAHESRRHTSSPNNMPDATRTRAYATLGVPLDADSVAIKSAYRRLVRAYHPDLHPGAPEHERHALAERFAEVTRAYKRLVA